MRIETLAAPMVEPLLLAEVKDHLRLDGPDHDAGLGALIVAARNVVEQHTGLALISRPVAVFLDDWPNSRVAMPWWQGTADGSLSALQRETDQVPLPVRPVDTITSVTIKDTLGQENTWAAEHYQLKPGMMPVLHCVTGSWPQPGQPVDGIRVTLTAGFGDSWNDVPADIRQALLQLIAHQYTNRGDTPSNALEDSGAGRLLMPYRQVRL